MKSVDHGDPRVEAGTSPREGAHQCLIATADVVASAGACEKRSMQSVCVFAGSNFGRSDAYAGAARALGAEIARRQLRLVYGGASVGLMGAVADEALRSWRDGARFSATRTHG